MYSKFDLFIYIVIVFWINWSPVNVHTGYIYFYPATKGAIIQHRKQPVNVSPLCKIGKNYSLKEIEVLVVLQIELKGPEYGTDIVFTFLNNFL